VEKICKLEVKLRTKKAILFQTQGEVDCLNRELDQAHANLVRTRGERDALGLRVFGHPSPGERNNNEFLGDKLLQDANKNLQQFLACPQPQHQHPAASQNTAAGPALPPSAALTMCQIGQQADTTWPATTQL